MFRRPLCIEQTRVKRIFRKSCLRRSRKELIYIYIYKFSFLALDELLHFLARETSKENCITRVSRRCEKALMERNVYKRAPLKILETNKFDRGIFDPSDFYETRNRFFAYVIVRDCTSVMLAIM